MYKCPDLHRTKHRNPVCILLCIMLRWSLRTSRNQYSFQNKRKDNVKTLKEAINRSIRWSYLTWTELQPRGCMSRRLVKLTVKLGVHSLVLRGIHCSTPVYHLDQERHVLCFTCLYGENKVEASSFWLKSAHFPTRGLISAPLEHHNQAAIAFLMSACLLCFKDGIADAHRLMLPPHLTIKKAF